MRVIFDAQREEMLKLKFNIRKLNRTLESNLTKISENFRFGFHEKTGQSHCTFDVIV